MAEGKDRLDFLTKLRVRELVLMGLITITAVMANLPHEYVEETLGVSHNTLLAILASSVIIGMFLYLKTGLFAAVVLLISGANMREKSAEGVRALFYAIEKNNLVYSQKVLSMNFDPNLHHDNGYTPLAYAAMKGNPAMIELLLRNGAEPAMTTKEGDTPVELALRMGHAEVADLLKLARQEAEAQEPDVDQQPAALAG